VMTMLGIRAAFWEDRDFSPAEAMFGTHLILPNQFVDTAVISQGSADHHGSWSSHFFLLQIGERTDKVSTLCLKPARTPDGTE
jgi:hypothetical protein